MTKKNLIKLLARCYPFLGHGACTIPEDNKLYKEAHELMKIIDPIVHADVYKILRENKKQFKVNKKNK